MPDWVAHTSRSTGKLYFFNKRTGQSVYERPPDFDGFDAEPTEAAPSTAQVPTSTTAGSAQTSTSLPQSVPPAPLLAPPRPPGFDNEFPPEGVLYGPATHGITGHGLRLPTRYPPLPNRPDVNPDIFVGLDDLFHKRFMLPTQGLVLPPLAAFFPAKRADPDPELLKLKIDTNAIKSRLDTKALGPWRNHTKFMLQTNDLVNAIRKFDVEMGTKAWCKMFEILVAYQLQPPTPECTSVHLCEAPGAFITATNHYLRQIYQDALQLQWRGITLNPYYEDNDPESMVHLDSFIIKTFDRWSFGADDKGDIRSSASIEALAVDTPPAHLVTADGSIDCSTLPDEQEAVVAHLFYCEAIAALRVLKRGGHFVLKMFTYFERSSLNLLFLLACTFEEVHVCKPASSTQGNAETYVIAKWYKDNIPKDIMLRLLEACDWRGEFTELPDLLDPAVIPRWFCTAVRDCADRMRRYACDVIERNIRTDGHIKNADKSAMRDLKREVARRFLDEIRLFRIPKEATLCGEAIRGDRLHTGALVSKRHDISNDNKAPGTLAERKAAKAARVDAIEANRKAMHDAPSSESQPAKRPRADGGAETAHDVSARTQRYGSFAAKMMEKMGYKEGEGLGKSQTGIVEPVAAKKLDRGMGLGYETGVLGELTSEIPDAPFFEEYDGPAAVPYTHFLETAGLFPDARSWKVICGAPLQAISMTRFGVSKTMKELVTQRRLLFGCADRVKRAIHPQMFAADRAAAVVTRKMNVFADETGDALKLALLDALYDICRVGAAECFRFAMFGRTGNGFAEYLAWKFEKRAVGTYCTSVAPTTMHSAARTVGRIVSSELHHIQMLEELVATGERHILDFAVIDIETTTLQDMSAHKIIESELSREASNPKLSFLVQVQSALRLLRSSNDAGDGGDLVVRMGDCYTRLSASVIYILYSTFSELRIVKPYLSSPSDPERFVVCTGFRGLPSDIDAVLTSAVEKCKAGQCVLSIVPMHLLLETTFLGCLCRTNDRLARRQLTALHLAEKDDVIVPIDDPGFLELGQEAIDRINLDTLKHGAETAQPPLQSDSQCGSMNKPDAESAMHTN